MVDYLIKDRGAEEGGDAVPERRVRQGRSATSTRRSSRPRGIETVERSISSPAPRISRAVLAKIAAGKPDYPVPRLHRCRALRHRAPGDRRRTTSRNSSWCAARSGPGLKNKDGIDDYIVYVPKYFEEAEKTEPKVKQFIADYKAFYKTRLPVRSGAAVLVVLLRPRLHAGRGDEEGRYRRRRRKDPQGAAVHDL